MGRAKTVAREISRMRKKKMKKCKTCGIIHSGIERFAIIFRCKCGRAILLTTLDDEGGGNTLGYDFPCMDCGRRWDLKFTNKMTHRKGFVQSREEGIGEAAGTLTQTDPEEIQLLINIAVEGMAWKKFAEEGRSSEGTRAKFLWEDAIKAWENYKAKKR